MKKEHFKRLFLGTLGIVVSLGSASAQTTEGVSLGYRGRGMGHLQSMSGDGRYVAFADNTGEIIPGVAGQQLIFVFDRNTKAYTVESISETGELAWEDCFDPFISENGKWVTFRTKAFLPLGQYYGEHWSDDLVILHERATKKNYIVSVGDQGQFADGPSWPTWISPDGSMVLFHTQATNLSGWDLNISANDVYLHYRNYQASFLVSRSASGFAGNSDSTGGSASSDGRFTAYMSEATDLVGGDTNGVGDIFLFDSFYGRVSRVSVDSSGQQGDRSSGDYDSSYDGLRIDGPSLSSDARYIVFPSYATNLDPRGSNNTKQIYVRDRIAKTTMLVSVDSSGNPGNGPSSHPRISGDGRYVTFKSFANNLVSEDTNQKEDIFLHDLIAKTTTRVNLNVHGEPRGGSQDYFYEPSISSDGRFVAFTCSSSLTEDYNLYFNVYVRDTQNSAVWYNYGPPLKGSNGYPSFTASADPKLCTTINLNLGNSRGSPTQAFLFAGFSNTDIHTDLGGHLLVLPQSIIPVALPASGVSFPVSVPCDQSYYGLPFFLQAIEMDPGASKGASFTRGLKLNLGN